MTDIPEEDNNDNEGSYEEFLEYNMHQLERTMRNLLAGMEAMEEVCDKLRAENRHLKSIIEMGAKKVH